MQAWRPRLPGRTDSTHTQGQLCWLPSQTSTRQGPGPNHDVASHTCSQPRSGAHLHPVQGLGLAGGLVDEVHVLHVFRDPLQEAQGLVEGDGHGDLGQLLQGPARTMRGPSPGSTAHSRPARRAPSWTDMNPPVMGEHLWKVKPLPPPLPVRWLRPSTPLSTPTAPFQTTRVQERPDWPPPDWWPAPNSSVSFRPPPDWWSQSIIQKSH